MYKVAEHVQLTSYQHFGRRKIALADKSSSYRYLVFISVLVLGGKKKRKKETDGMVTC